MRKTFSAATRPSKDQQKANMLKEVPVRRDGMPKTRRRALDAQDAKSDTAEQGPQNKNKECPSEGDEDKGSSQSIALRVPSDAKAGAGCASRLARHGRARTTEQKQGMSERG